MRDGLLRRVLKRIARAHGEVNLATARALAVRRGDRPYALAGECGRCATCCEEPAIRVSRFVWYVGIARGAFLGWQRVVNGFRLARRDPASHSFVFECTHFDRANRACDSYESRPLMCRDYPRVLLWQANPELFPNCGYRAVAPNADRLLQILDSQTLTPEQRAKLERGLRLER